MKRFLMITASLVMTGMILQPAHAVAIGSTSTAKYQAQTKITTGLDTNQDPDSPAANPTNGTYSVSVNATVGSNAFSLSVKGDANPGPNGYGNAIGDGKMHDVDNILIQFRHSNGTSFSVTGLSGSTAAGTWAKVNGARLLTNGVDEGGTLGGREISCLGDDTDGGSPAFALFANGSNAFNSGAGTTAASTFVKGDQYRVSLEDEDQLWTTDWQSLNTPEPGTLALALPALAPFGLMMLRRRRSGAKVEDETEEVI